MLINISSHEETSFLGRDLVYKTSLCKRKSNRNQFDELGLNFSVTRPWRQNSKVENCGDRNIVSIRYHFFRNKTSVKTRTERPAKPTYIIQCFKALLKIGFSVVRDLLEQAVDVPRVR